MTVSVVSVRHHGRVALLTLDNPPMNAINWAMRQQLNDAVDAALADDSVDMLLILCAGRTFIVGVDIAEFDAPMAEPTLQQVQAKIEKAHKPVAVAIHGNALGGGLELAMACHYRFATRTARLGLPELSLGIIPGAGGTQRLPRLIGPKAAFDMILTSRPIAAERAAELGLVDELIGEDDLAAAALAECARLLSLGSGPRPTSALSADRSELSDADIDSALEANATSLRGRTTQHALIAAIRAASDLPYEEGLAREYTLAMECLDSRESAALRHLFFAERQATRPAGMKVPPLDPGAVAVIGAHGDAGLLAAALEEAGLATMRDLTDGAAYKAVLCTTIDEADAADLVRNDQALLVPHDSVNRLEGAVGFQLAGRSVAEILVPDGANGQAVAWAVEIARRLKRFPAFSYGSAPSAGTRMLVALKSELNTLVEQGTAVAQIQDALVTFGFPAKLVAGWLACSEASHPQGAAFDGATILNRGLLALINAGAHCLADESAARAADLDAMWVAGFGFPRYWGGPMFYADHIGIVEIQRQLAALGEAGGLAPAALLNDMAASGQTFRQRDQSK